MKPIAMKFSIGTLLTAVVGTIAVETGAHNWFSHPELGQVVGWPVALTGGALWATVIAEAVIHRRICRGK